MSYPILRTEEAKNNQKQKLKYLKTNWAQVEVINFDNKKEEANRSSPIKAKLFLDKTLTKSVTHYIQVKRENLFYKLKQC